MAPPNSPSGPNAAGAGALFSFVFPMWNEEEIIERTVVAAHEAGQRLILENEIADYEIVVVNDASTDATGSIADRLAAEDRRVRVLHHQTNRKLGGSIKSGFVEARGDFVLYTDADLPFDLLDTIKAMRLLRIYEADLVCAYRLDRTGEGPRRAVYSYAYNSLVRMALGLHVRDVNFAFKLLRRSVLDKVTLTSEGSFIDAELLCRSQAAGFRTIQFGVDYFPRYRGVSTLSSPRVILTILAEMRRLVPELRALRAPAE
ncbi:MAG: glycosyltransferase family 2 protein [Acidimicrobiales bacterium]